MFAQLVCAEGSAPRSLGPTSDPCPAPRQLPGVDSSSDPGRTPGAAEGLLGSRMGRARRGSGLGGFAWPLWVCPHPGQGCSRALGIAGEHSQREKRSVPTARHFTMGLSLGIARPRAGTCTASARHRPGLAWAPLTPPSPGSLSTAAFRWFHFMMTLRQAKFRWLIWSFCFRDKTQSLQVPAKPPNMTSRLSVAGNCLHDPGDLVTAELLACVPQISKCPWRACPPRSSLVADL